METTAKTDSFLKAIKKQALEKQESMLNEISIIHQTEVAGAGYPRRGFLSRTGRIQPLCGEEGQEDGHPVWGNDLQLQRRI